MTDIEAIHTTINDLANQAQKLNNNIYFHKTHHPTLTTDNVVLHYMITWKKVHVKYQ